MSQWHQSSEQSSTVMATACTSRPVASVVADRSAPDGRKYVTRRSGVAVPSKKVAVVVHCTVVPLKTARRSGTRARPYAGLRMTPIST